MDFSVLSRFLDVLAISSTAWLNALSFIFDGVLKPDIFLINCREDSVISISVAGGSKLNNVLILLHMVFTKCIKGSA